MTSCMCEPTEQEPNGNIMFRILLLLLPITAELVWVAKVNIKDGWG